MGCKVPAVERMQTTEVPIGNGNFDHHVGDDILEMALWMQVNMFHGSPFPCLDLRIHSVLMKMLMQEGFERGLQLAVRCASIESCPQIAATLY